MFSRLTKRVWLNKKLTTYTKIQVFEETLVQQAKAKRKSQKQQNQGAGLGTECICLPCGRDCHFRIGLLSHTRCCSKSSIQSTLPLSFETEGCLTNSHAVIMEEEDNFVQILMHVCASFCCLL